MKLGHFILFTWRRRPPTNQPTTWRSSHCEICASIFSSSFFSFSQSRTRFHNLNLPFLFLSNLWAQSCPHAVLESYREFLSRFLDLCKSCFGFCYLYRVFSTLILVLFVSFLHFDCLGVFGSYPVLG